MLERIVVDELVIDTKKRIVTLKGRDLVLTPKEYGSSILYHIGERS